MSNYHQPVLVQECLDLLAPGPGHIVIDGTVGGGGHAEKFLEATSPDGMLLGLDRDPEALTEAGRRLARFGERVILRQAVFSQMGQVWAESGLPRADCILLDLGVSSHQLDAAERGFSFSRPGPLDMRMNFMDGQCLAEFLQETDQDELASILTHYGEVPNGKRIARAILEKRESIRDTAQLAMVVEKAAGFQGRKRAIHPATLVFQALRIAINREMDELDIILNDLPEPLEAGGRVGIISYHSLEDRKVKARFRELQGRCICPPGMPVCGCGQSAIMETLTAKAVKPSDEELRLNNRSRSGRLRAARRLP